jgi:ribosome biogenesis GTPase / thiamine phosphate phosphatase
MDTSSSFDALVAYGWSDRVAALYHSHPASHPSSPARVTRVERSACTVVDRSGVERPLPVTAPVAVGDWVVIAADRLEALLARWSSLERQDPDGARAQVLAANVDLVLVTVPADRPNAARAERELTLAWDSGARPVVVLTKTDLGGEHLAGELASRLVGADIVATSAETGAGVDQLASLLAPGQTAVLLGPSGAGKSTLTNALVGEHCQMTAAVRAQDRRGRHTTSSRQLLALASGGVLIDTPGLRSLGLMSADGIGEVFPDVDGYACACRFRDCQYRDEPGCAVTAAVAAGQLGAERLASYRKLVREAAAEQRRTDPFARQQAQRLWKQRSKDARRQDKRR